MPAALTTAHKNRRDQSAFKTLIASPKAGSFVMPANGRVAFASPSGCAAGVTAGTIGSRTIVTPLLPARGKMNLQHVEKGVVVAPRFGFEVQIDIGLGRYKVISTGFATEKETAFALNVGP